MIFGMVDNALLSLVKVAIPASTVVVLCARGVMLAERVGVLNLGQEGLIGIGAVYAVIAATEWGVGSPWISMLIGMVAAAMAGAVFAVVVVVFRANQVLAGLALAIGGIGLSNQLGVNRNGTPIRTLFAEINPGGRFTSNAFLETFFFHDPVVYIAYILLPAAFWFLLFRTRHGMNMKAVGENPASADAAGVNVTWARIGYSVAGASLGRRRRIHGLDIHTDVGPRHCTRTGLERPSGRHIRSVAAFPSRSWSAFVWGHDLAWNDGAGQELEPSVPGASGSELLPVNDPLPGHYRGDPHSGRCGKIRPPSSIYKRAWRPCSALFARGALTSSPNQARRLNHRCAHSRAVPPLPLRISGRIVSSDMHALWRTGPAAGNALDRSRT